MGDVITVEFDVIELRRLTSQQEDISVGGR
jgi:hypothetical protein